MLSNDVSQFISGCSSLSDNIQGKMQSHRFPLGHLSNLYVLLLCLVSDVSGLGCLAEEDRDNHTHLFKNVISQWIQTEKITCIKHETLVKFLPQS